MSQRERWIVYPLIFFALGAAVRDKVLQRIEAKEIVCENLAIVDQEQPSLALVELGIKRHHPNNPAQLADRVGQLRIFDSDGKVVSALADGTFTEQLITQDFEVIGSKGLPLFAVEAVPVLQMAAGGAAPTVVYQGVVTLDPQRLGFRLAPPPADATGKRHDGQTDPTP